MRDLNLYLFQPRARSAGLSTMLEKHLARGKKAMILTDDEALAKKIDEELWAYDQDSFLPHAVIDDPAVSQPHHDAQSILILPLDKINDSVKEIRNYNDASAVFLWLDTFSNITDLLNMMDDKVSQWFFLFSLGDKYHEGIMAKIFAIASAEQNHFHLKAWHQNPGGGWRNRSLAAGGDSAAAD